MATDIIEMVKQNPEVKSWVIHDSTEFKIRGEHFDNIRLKLMEALDVPPKSVVVYDMRRAELGDIDCLIDFFQDIRMKTVEESADGEVGPMPTLILHGMSGGDLNDEAMERLGDYISRIMGNSSVPARVMLWVTKAGDSLANEKKLLRYFDNIEGAFTCCGEVY